MENQVSMEKKKVLIETWGCQMNVADSEQMLALLQTSNYQATTSQEDADLILLNTCHIREKAKHKVLSRLGRLKELKDKKPGLKIAVSGCVAQAEGKKLLDDAPQIDVLLGPGKIEELPGLLEQQSALGLSVSALGFASTHAKTSAGVQAENETVRGAHKPTISGRNEISRYVNIAQGCDNFCTFCVVPHTRGREISRSPHAILAEAQSHLDGGAREISLLGQNVNSYGNDLVRDGHLHPSVDGAFVDLLRAAAQLEGLKRLRFTTSNPHDFTEPLANLFAEFPVMGRYVHLPVQSGNDTVLERMKRKVTVAEYFERVSWLREIDPSFALSTDIIVGFPGETDEQFMDTVRLVEKVRFNFIFSFMYSPRKHTAAIRFRDQVPEEVKQERLKILNQVQEKITVEENKKDIGQVRQVLFHYESRKRPGSYYGRTEHFRLVRVDSTTDILGQELPVLITDANKTALVGELVR